MIPVARSLIVPTGVVVGTANAEVADPTATTTPDTARAPATATDTARREKRDPRPIEDETPDTEKPAVTDTTAS